MCYYDSVESVRQSRALSERNRPGLFVKGSEHMPYRRVTYHVNILAVRHLIPHGQMYCEEHKPLHTKDRAHAAERGYGAKWQRERRKFLESNPFCVKC